MTAVQVRLVNAYAVLVMGGRKTLDDVPSELREVVEMRIAEVEIEKLEV